jgi:hypothetical protein
MSLLARVTATPQAADHRSAACGTPHTITQGANGRRRVHVGPVPEPTLPTPCIA